MDDDYGLYDPPYPDDYALAYVIDEGPEDPDDELDDWRDADYWRDDDPDPSEPNCFTCHDYGVTYDDKPCPSCNPPAWLIRWWTLQYALTAPYRWLRRQLRPRPRYDDEPPF